VIVALAVAWAPAPLRAEPRPDVLLVTLDTVRADRLGCYGDRTARTPVLDGLAARGVRWRRAVTAAPLTLPAHASLLTGLEPPQHGVRDNGAARLPPGVKTLAEALAARGWLTLGFVASRVLDHRFGLDRGFQLYDDRMAAERVGQYGYAERDAAAVTDAALRGVAERLAGAPGRPWFVWVHYYDPHAPYAPPGAPAEAGEGERYAGEIARVDRELGRLLRGLPGDPGRRLVAVVADHGESLGEHGERGHGLFLYGAGLEVPLLLAGPGLPAGRVVEGPVATRRLAATLLRLARPAETARPFGPPLPGLGGGGAADPVYSEALLPATAYGWSPLTALTTAEWRYIAAPRPELYDLAADPREERDLAATRRDVAASLARALAARTAGMARSGAPAAAPDPELAAALRSLGYLSGASAPAATARGGRGGIDPKDGVAMLAELEQAKRLLASGAAAAALPRLESLVRRSPGNVPFLTHYAGALLAAGDGERALAAYRRAISLNPRLDLLHLNLADALLRLGRLPEARAAYELALRLDPRLARAWLGRGEIALREGKREEERRLLERGLAAGTASAAILARLAQLDLAAGDLAQAEGRLAEATALAPAWPPAWLVWGEVAERRGRSDEALARYAKAIELDPRSAPALLRAGRLLLRAGRAAGGRALLERLLALAPRPPEAAEAARLLATAGRGGPSG
jgi:arylsulfatase A-like enzyme/Tfp pilus assembly protein PilF